jgi:hypothetical protein
MPGNEGVCLFHKSVCEALGNKLESLAEGQKIIMATQQARKCEVYAEKFSALADRVEKTEKTNVEQWLEINRMDKQLVKAIAIAGTLSAFLGAFLNIVARLLIR